MKKLSSIHTIISIYLDGSYVGEKGKSQKIIHGPLSINVFTVFFFTSSVRISYLKPKGFQKYGQKVRETKDNRAQKQTKRKSREIVDYR